LARMFVNTSHMPDLFRCKERTGDWELPAPWKTESATLAFAILNGTADLPSPAQPLQLTGCMAAFVPLPLAGTIHLRDATALIWPLETAPPKLPLRQALVLDEASAGVIYDVFLEQNRSDELLSSALIFLGHRLAEQAPPSPPTASGSSLVERVMDYLKGNLEEPIALEHLAKQFDCSKSSLNRHFLSERGDSPIRALAGLRIAHARQLLQSIDQTISQVAHAAGYSDLASFSHFFKQHTGQSPSEFRENCQWLA
jgi:AraC-like DNA-binding protein